MALSDWLSIKEISHLWGEETGHDPAVLRRDLEAWFAEFVKETPDTRQARPGVALDTIMVNRLLGMLGARYLERKTFEAYCEDRGHAKPVFWIAGREADGSGVTLERAQKELIDRATAVSGEVAELKEQLEAYELWGTADGDPDGLGLPLRRARTRRAWRGRAILAAGFGVPLVVLLLWGIQSATQLSALKREMADLSAAAEASDALIVKLRGDLAMVRQALELGRLAPSSEVAAVGEEKGAALAESETSIWSQDSLGGEGKLDGADEEVRETKAQDSGQEQTAGQSSPDRTPEGESGEAAPQGDDLLAAAETGTMQDTVSPVDLLLEPGHHLGREVVVSGSVVWFLRRYWLRSDSGRMSILIDIENLEPEDRDRLEAAVVQFEFLAQARARITGMIEKQGSGTFQLAASKLELIE